MGLNLFCIKEKASIIWVSAAAPQRAGCYWFPYSGTAQQPPLHKAACCVPGKTEERNHSSSLLVGSELCFASG